MHKIDWLNIKGVILDMDGVIYRGDKKIKSAIKAIKIWQNKNISICFLTNNSTKSQYQFSSKLKSMGLLFKKDTIITSAICASNYLRDNYLPGTKIYVVGSQSLKKIILDNGFINDEKNAKIVIAGLDQKITYKKIDIASKLIRNGAKFVGTNSDKLYPVEKDFKPGAGTIIEFIKAASNNAECLYLGKPNPYFVNSAIKYIGLKKKNIILIGDQLETDILSAINTNLKSVLVKTGVKNLNTNIKATITVDSLMELPLSY